MKRNIWVVLMVTGLWSCSKTDFLNAKPNNSLVVPSSIADFQALLDNDVYMNGSGNSNGVVPQLGETGADNYYIPNDIYFSSDISQTERNEYIWASNPYLGLGMPDWDIPYKAVFYSNLALGGLANIPINSQNYSDWDNCEGSALFYRAQNFYQLAQVFASAYDSSDAKIELGIPLRLGSDVNEKIQRSTLQQTYDRTISDLTAAATYLPVKALYGTRPSKPAAYALLARIYQTMQNYPQAILYADSCLALHDSLLDFNTLDTTAPYPVPRFNSENLFYAIIIRSVPLLIGSMDSVLFNSYGANDLRRSIFFVASPEGYQFRGSYDGTSNVFGGIATDEIYLIRAECYARMGNVNAAMNDLNALLIKRWARGTFIPYTATDATDALQQILRERRKELVFRGLRWTDLRRLNMDPAFELPLITRVIQGTTYTLPAGDSRYTWPIPQDVLSFNPGMQQN